jgi:tetratricopeptide (TPR) repeat protein
MTEYQSAIVREISVLKIFEMGLRPMNYKVVQSYSKLGLYEMVIGNRSRALYFLHKSLLLMLINFGETYPDILVTLANIARIYQQDKEFNNAVNCYLKALDLVKSVTCKYHINISFCYSSLASLHYEMKDIKKAIEYQTESVATLCNFVCNLGEIFDEKDSRLSDAKKILKVYHDLAHQGSVYTPQQVPGPKVVTKVETKEKKK